MKTLIAIPAFNEEASLGAVLANLAEHHPLTHVVVIDDGSNGRTNSRGWLIYDTNSRVSSRSARRR